MEHPEEPAARRGLFVVFFFEGGFRVWGVLGFRGGELGASFFFVVCVVGFAVWWGGVWG